MSIESQRMWPMITEKTPHLSQTVGPWRRDALV